MKTCSLCKQTKPPHAFDKYSKNTCTTCTSKRKRLWAQNNPEKRKAAALLYNKTHQAQAVRYRREYSRRPERIARKKEWEQQYLKQPQPRLRSLHRARLRSFFTRRSNGIHVMVGCDIAEFCAHLESQFQIGMTWENYGRNGWELDHITPLCLFDLSDPVQFQAAFHFTNVQPLWKSDNMKKHTKVPDYLSNTTLCP